MTDAQRVRSKNRILYVEGNEDGTVGGSFYSLLFLTSGLDRTRYEPVVSFYFDHPLVPRFNAAGIRTMVLPPGRPVKLPSLPGRIIAKTANFVKGFVLDPIRLASMLRHENFAMVHLNNSIISNHVWMVAARYAGIACVTHERGINPGFKRRARLLAKGLDAIICISNAVEENFNRLGLGDLPLVTIPNGLDPGQMRASRSRAEVCAELGIPPESQMIGIVGNIKKWKGQDVVIRAMAALVQQFDNVRCLIIGDNAAAARPFGLEVQSLIDGLHLQERVVLTGFRRNVADYINALDILVHASVLPEPFGRVLLEGMALSKPIAASRGGAVPEIVVDGETGLLFEPGSHSELARCLASLLSDRDRALQMGRAGRERLVTHFGIDRNIKATTALYDKILSRRLEQSADT